MTQYTPLPETIHALVGATPGSVLLETSRLDAENHRSYLFLDPLRVLTAHTPDELPNLFAQIESALAAGCFVTGFLSYESGYSLQGIADETRARPAARLLRRLPRTHRLRPQHRQLQRPAAAAAAAAAADCLHASNRQPSPKTRLPSASPPRTTGARSSRSKSRSPLGPPIRSTSPIASACAPPPRPPISTSRSAASSPWPTAR